jgi:hypothetical protein
MRIGIDNTPGKLDWETLLNLYYPKQKDSSLFFLKDTNVIQNLIWSICSGMMVAKYLRFDGLLPSLCPVNFKKSGIRGFYL